MAKRKLDTETGIAKRNDVLNRAEVSKVLMNVNLISFGVMCSFFVLDGNIFCEEFEVFKKTEKDSL